MVELEMQNEDMRSTLTELENSKSRYKELYDFAPVGYVTLDRFGLIHEANLTAATLLHVTRAALIGKHLQSFMEQESADALHLFLRKPIPSGTHEMMECRLRQADGTPFDISLNASGEYDPSDRLLRYRAVFMDVSRLKLMERQALETGERLRLLASELNLAEERTRKAIAETLHDEVCQTLAVARMKLSYALTLPNNKDAEKIHHELHDMLALAIKQTRALMMEISPPVLHDLSLGAAIDWMAERMISERGTEVKTVKTGDFSDLEQNMTIMLYQMTRELLANVVKHSGGHHVLVTVERDEQAIGITVRDDGKGFDAGGVGSPTAESGFGLFSIRERLKSYNGSLQIESQKEKGTTVSIRLPVEGKSG
jgi:PAS domain S-box-containing protein